GIATLFDLRLSDCEITVARDLFLFCDLFRAKIFLFSINWVRKPATPLLAGRGRRSRVACASSNGTRNPDLVLVRCRVLINAQIAAPAFLGHNHRLSKKTRLAIAVVDWVKGQWHQ